LLGYINREEQNNGSLNTTTMKYLKYPLLLLLALIVIGIILTFIGPKDLNVNKSIDIEAPASIVYSLTNNLKNMELWNEWTLSDTTVQTEYNAISSGVGASSSWTSAVNGKGTQKIIESVSNQRVRSQLNFEGWEGDNFADINIQSNGESQTVSYTFEGTPLPWWMRGMALVTGMKGMMKSNYEKSLGHIKRIAEERALGVYGGYQMEEKVMDERNFIMTRQIVEGSGMQQFYAANLGGLFMKAQQGGLTMQGMPCGLYFSYPENESSKIDLAAAIPISEVASVPGATSYTIPSKQAVTLDFYGDYTNLGEGHSAIFDYMADRGYLMDMPFTEEYANDPTQVDDPSKILTKITYYYTATQ